MNKNADQIPLVSVVMPVKNAETTVEESIRSILNQSLKEFEFIIIDDNSTDSTKTILEKYRHVDPRLKIVKNSESGMCNARNLGMELARSKLYAVMDSDDIASPERLQRQYETFEANENLVLLGSYCYVFEKDTSNAVKVDTPTDNNEIKKSILSFPTLMHPSIMTTVEALKGINGYRRHFEGAEDHDLYLRLSNFGEFSVLPEYLMYYRSHDNQFSRRNKAQGYRASVASVFCFQRVMENQSDPSELGMPCDQIALELLNSMVVSRNPMEKKNIKLCVRAILGLALLPNLQASVLKLRSSIFLNLVRNKQLSAAFVFWRSTRRAKWLNQ